MKLVKYVLPESEKQGLHEGLRVVHRRHAGHPAVTTSYQISLHCMRTAGLLPVIPCFLDACYPREQHTDNADNQGSPEGRPESVYLKSEVQGT